MARIFISYKRADKNIVFPIKDKIEKALGERCWIDLDGIESDAQFVSVIIKAINQASIFLFMYSHHHSEITDFDNDWTVREINFAQKKQKRIVFVNIDRTPLSDYFEILFGLKQQVDALSHESFNRLLEDLKIWLSIENSEPKNINNSIREATSYTEGLNYVYDFNRREATVKGIYGGTWESVSIPPFVEKDGAKFKVVKIEEWAFAKCRLLTSVYIPDTVEEIGNYAFEDCDKLTSIFWPNTLREIGAEAFKNCSSLRSVTLPSQLKRLERHAFMNCQNLSSITIPQSILFIGIGAFWGCFALKSATIPTTDPNIGITAFDRTCKVIRKK